MLLQYPSLNLSVEPQGATPGAYLFLITVETSSASTATMMLIGPPPGGYVHSVPPADTYAAAAHKMIVDMRMLLAEGVDKFVETRMRAERRVSRRDLEEAEELATHTLEAAKSIDERDLMEAEKDTLQKIESGGIRRKRPRPQMGDAGAIRTSGARELAAHGFTDIHAISVADKGPGLWYEATEPSPSWKSPHDWTPRADPPEQVLLLRQAPDIWHVFYRYNATTSGSDPGHALKGGLGDAIDSNAQMKRYCDLVLAAPSRLSEEYDGLNAAKSQCYEDRRLQA